jgi:hypothetical protein
MRSVRTTRLLVLFSAAVLFTRVAAGPGASGTTPEGGAPASSAVTAGASGHGRIGVYLTEHAAAKQTVLDGVVQAAARGQINAVVIDVKDNNGDIAYASAVPLARQIGAVFPRLDLRTLVPTLRARGLYVIARQVVFYDPRLAKHLGSSSAEWVLPSDERAVVYNLEIAQEVAGLGFDEIQFDYIRFPDGGKLEPVYESRYAAVNRFLSLARQRLSGRVLLSADLFGRVTWPWNERRIDPIGQSLEEVGERVDFISPMLYPSHYHEQVYKDDPYRTVTDALGAGLKRTTTPLRPFLQAFNMAIPSGMTLEGYIRAQVKAARALGADGYLFWNPSSDYSALWRALE